MCSSDNFTTWNYEVQNYQELLNRRGEDLKITEGVY